MMQQKNNENYAKKFRELPLLEKEKVTNFFNLHNAASWMYLQMSEAAQEYTKETINSSAIAMQESIQEAEEEINNE